jgi:hypothetical protein
MPETYFSNFHIFYFVAGKGKVGNEKDRKKLV